MKMKRLAASLLMTAVIMLAGCGKQEQTDSNLLKEMETANQVDAFLEKYGVLAYRDTISYADGTSENIYCYLEPDRYIYESAEGIIICENGEGYGFINKTQRAYRFLFVEDAYEAYFQRKYDGTKFFELDEYNKYEVITSQEEKDGIVTVQTEITDKAFIDDYMEYHEYEPGDIEKIEYIYTVDAKSREIYTMKGTALTADGESMVFSDFERVLEIEAYQVDEQLTEAVFGGERRTLTLIVDVGTDAEQTYTQTISKGNRLKIKLPSDYDQTIYWDTEYTQEYDIDDDCNEDVTLYARSSKSDKTN